MSTFCTYFPRLNVLTFCCSFIPNAMHMGEPAVGPIILKWIEELLGVEQPPKTNGHA